MRLDFNVLWVDDQPNAVNAQITRIKNQMESEGFSFRPTQCKSLAEVETLIAEDIFQDEIDLILVDWDLGGGVHGQDVISKVREVAQYKDVVFYSARTPATELRKLAFDRQLEGIYCASREELVDEVLGVFESLVKKVLDLDHTRGIVMGATSDIDHLVNICLSHAHAALDDNGKTNFINEALRRIKEKVENISKQSEKIAKNPSIDTIFKAHMLFSSDDRLRMLSAILEMEKFEAHKEAKNTISSYRKNVVPDRNILGHMVLAPEGKPQAVATTEGKQVGLDDMRTLRRLILSLREDFRALADSLTPR
ncbi:hypothetical protein [Burkholderia ubonensis]|uniref:hypothetical protein n=1 Tax=Burkholderia ubonensis TaxID=101571 RepID=UPI000759CD47|nr:hypothetical protein [Burkholderia ubonensis]KVU75280.1 hypothetical protein WK73_13710 [Burkholderia ubonensis]KWE82514.1 hypothetical protein WL81_30665 [Burkholderia ubonensis]